MRRNKLVVFLLMTLMTSSLSGCLGLLQARETIEGLREDVYEVEYPTKVSMSYIFTTIELLPHTNFTKFLVDDSVTKIDIYFKVSFAFSDAVSCIDNIFTKEARYIEVEIATPSGVVIYEEDTCRDVPPNTKTIENDDGSLEYGDWSLSIESRGAGESVFDAVQDNYLIIVTVYRTCEQYPMEPPCDE